MSTVKWKYRSLEDFLSSRPLDVDGLLDDGWNTMFPVKGREIDAVVLFVDISNFSARTNDLHPVETLIFVNNFFSWISAEALQSTHGIIDKYIGDEMMIVFSKDFGSDDPFVDALITARWMAERDHIGFRMHAGIAVGRVIVGYVGTPLKYNCSTFGAAVTMAKRCGEAPTSGMCSSYMIFPASAWRDRSFDKVFQKRKVKDPDGKTIEIEHAWAMKPARTVSLKNLPDLDVVEISLECLFSPPISAVDRAKLGFEGLKQEGRYRPQRYAFESEIEPQ